MKTPWNFQQMFCIALLMNVGSLLFQMLVPTYLTELNYSLHFSGVNAMLFGIGSAAGSILLGLRIKHGKPEHLIVGSLLTGGLLLALYFLHCGRTGTQWMLCLLAFAGGMLASSSFPQIVAMTRDVNSSVPLSTRMALIVGGTWGLAGILFLGIGQFGARYGLGIAMQSTWIFYLLAGGTASFFLLKRHWKKIGLVA